MSAKHTQGPWREGQPGNFRVYGPNTKEGAGLIAQVAVRRLQGTGCANVRLIAAAPELLEALKDAVALIDRRARAFDATVLIGDLREQVIQRAEAAIAKAEGRA